MMYGKFPLVKCVRFCPIDDPRIKTRFYYNENDSMESKLETREEKWEQFHELRSKAVYNNNLCRRFLLHLICLSQVNGVKKGIKIQIFYTGKLAVTQHLKKLHISDTDIEMCNIVPKHICNQLIYA